MDVSLEKIPLDSSIRLYMVLTKDIERIIICSNTVIESYLRTESKDGILFEYHRPFGSLLLDLESDNEHFWNVAIFNLGKAYDLKYNPLENIHELLVDKESPAECESIAFEILQSKFNQDNPISKYVALKIWLDYQRIMSNHTDLSLNYFIKTAQRLTRPLQNKPVALYEAPQKVLPEHILLRWSTELDCPDREMIIVKPYRDISDEYIVADSSLIPLKNYYIEKLQQWDKYLLSCKECGKFFLASSLHYEYCSNTCRAAARANQLIARAEIPSVKKLDRLCRREYQYWYNRLHKIKASGKWSDDQIMIFRLAMNKFQDEKVLNRKRCSDGDISYSELASWFSAQRDVADKLLNNL